MPAQFIAGAGHDQVRSGIRGAKERVAARKAAEEAQARAARKADLADCPFHPDLARPSAVGQMTLAQTISAFRLARAHGHGWATDTRFCGVTQPKIDYRHYYDESITVHRGRCCPKSADWRWHVPSQAIDAATCCAAMVAAEKKDGEDYGIVPVLRDGVLWHETCTGRTVWSVDQSGTVRMWFWSADQRCEEYDAGKTDARLSSAEASCVIHPGRTGYEMAVRGRRTRVPAQIYFAFMLPVPADCEP